MHFSAHNRRAKATAAMIVIWRKALIMEDAG